MKLSKNLWRLFFLILFVLSLDYWWWDAPMQFGWLNLPLWLYYFILLQLLFFAGFYFFSRQYWQSRED